VIAARARRDAIRAEYATEEAEEAEEADVTSFWLVAFRPTPGVPVLIGAAYALDDAQRFCQWHAASSVPRVRIRDRDWIQLDPAVFAAGPYRVSHWTALRRYADVVVAEAQSHAGPRTDVPTGVGEEEP
jgi:hypothetical protein